ncbi:hypothetical protein [uncultured Aureimonas sp.]|uniref:hypothetical protein n=1 Tax=uncultured Aureimonas sp. TaxID=1604662 RepID=UPI0025DBAAD8|nr:hypothetical protein [uncultured Aureimonas sp.]
MSNIPIQNDETTIPDPQVEEMAAKHGISVEDARRHLHEQSQDRPAADGAAEAEKLGRTD